MHLFINERSFCGQFHAREDIRPPVLRFLKLVNAARAALSRNGGRMWRSAELSTASLKSGEVLVQSLNHFGRDLLDGFKTVVFDMANPAPWQPERMHTSEHTYLWQSQQGSSPTVGEDVTDTSIAELTERKLREAMLHGCLLNIEGSPFDDQSSIQVLKLDYGSTQLRCSFTEIDFEDWLRRSVGEVAPYSNEATDPPRDEQTCLADRTTYELTGRELQGRKIYRHLTNNQLYYVDNLHYGAAAHLEVFDKLGRKHVGEASLDGKLLPRTKDPKKKPLEI